MASSEVSFNNELEYYFISFPCSNSGFLKKKHTWKGVLSIQWPGFLIALLFLKEAINIKMMI